MKFTHVVSNVFFIAFVVALLVAIIFFEIGIRAFRNQNERKSKESNRLGFRWLLIAVGLLLLSIITSLF
ncbi:hypothetical protein [Fervidobacterium thailandense]|uniref:Uncharacterized protein n=1 Tax=Fervidobacterium thailandense TaxID=1008305 RepID=A0A1E3G1J2_9BACT|nr:hypothetical protein [Fervidobacterium thailandense]ODN30121.1 hypothetical protein A4H02_07095 [Fervidobacterium thailandense]